MSIYTHSIRGGGKQSVLLHHFASFFFFFTLNAYAYNKKLCTVYASVALRFVPTGRFIIIFFLLLKWHNNVFTEKKKCFCCVHSTRQNNFLDVVYNVFFFLLIQERIANVRYIRNNMDFWNNKYVHLSGGGVVHDIRALGNNHNNMYNAPQTQPTNHNHPTNRAIVL